MKKDIVDNSITIKDITQSLFGIEKNFAELEGNKKQKVLKYIKKNKLNIRLFDIKGFDIINNTFFAYEYKLDNDFFDGFCRKKVCFENFDVFYENVNDAIYDNSCYYGYIFSDDDIDKYNLDIARINFESFINYNIDSFTFDRVVTDLTKKDLVGNQSVEVQDVVNWYNSLKVFDSIQSIIREKALFFMKFHLDEYQDVFFSLVINKFGNSIKNLLIEYICSYGVKRGITFEDILINFGKDSAQRIIDNYNAGSIKTANTKKINYFKKILSEYDENKYIKYVGSGYNLKNKLYYATELFKDETGEKIYIKKWFFSFEELVNEVDGNLKSSNLLEAPIEREEILKYSTTDKTILPRKKYFNKYSVKKGFDRNFYVLQQWLDENDDVVVDKRHNFEYFFDFVHFLKRDLSDANFLMFDDITRIKNEKNLNLRNIHVRSDIAKQIGISACESLNKSYDYINNEISEKNELDSIKNFELQHQFDSDYSKEVSYVTDIHLIHRFYANKGKTLDDLEYIINKIINNIKNQSSYINLIGGDITNDIDIFRNFINKLSGRCQYFIILGNHELWNKENKTIDDIKNEYKSIISYDNIHLLQNNAFLFKLNGICELKEEDIESLSFKELRDMARDVNLILFGGIGFSGLNQEFNANNNIYRGTITREQEIKESEKFYKLYKKIVDVFYDKNVIIFTHMPFEDWSSEEYHDNFVYVSGHNHRNYFYDDGKKRIYNDNQIGYKQKEVNMKKFSIDYGYDWYSNYEDGIYEITKGDYEKFYRGIGEFISFNKVYKKIYMLKRENIYLFLLENDKGNLLVLNGGFPRRCEKHNLEYYYTNMVNYSKSIKLFLNDFITYQKNISNEIKRIGGRGTIHGSIVDIDFSNHLYINPLDGTITPYFAYSMVDKYVYNNLKSLLKYKCPELYRNYIDIVNCNSENNSLIIKENNIELCKKKIYVSDTSMYRISKILKGLQFTTNNNVIRLWNDTIACDCSKNAGQLIVSGLINPEEMEIIHKEQKAIEKEQKNKQEVKKKKTTPKKSIIKIELTPEEREQKRFEIYKEKISSITKDIDIVEYKNAKVHATYKCNICGNIWSIRPDKFKDRQHYLCPKCKCKRNN